MTNTYTIQHKACGMTTIIEGYDIYDAMRKAGKSFSAWTVID
jgi:hypothetical protein